ncbi:unnamed protein product [Notodromas monacha]|uniref:Uncharacterized protein n=1 Tax=Notodromas monacha TaxID=399045 RepID=A0A7R9BFY9_9CRUS|nr:unnamed protein product [Notodromas monacha]CAG0914567.1 unnamed protein product [Notodromas monacha]
MNAILKLTTFLLAICSFLSVARCQLASAAVGLKGFNPLLLKELSRCKQTWQVISARENPPEVSKCVYSLLMAAGQMQSNPQKISAPVPFKSLDPLLMPGTGTLSSQVMFGEITNAYVTGLSTAFAPGNMKVKYSRQTKNIAIILMPSAPGIRLQANYTAALDVSALMGGQSRFLPAFTTGNVIVDAAKFVSELTLKMVKQKITGLLRAKSGNCTVETGRMQVKIVGSDSKDAFAKFVSELTLKMVKQKITGLLRAKSGNCTVETGRMQVKIVGSDSKDAFVRIHSEFLNSADGTEIVANELKRMICATMTRNLLTLLQIGWKGLDKILELPV